jgi:hypothetical protein
MERSILGQNPANPRYTECGSAASGSYMIVIVWLGFGAAALIVPRDKPA